ncbi:35922_t:CDS:2, partial [Racocetra persica]
RMVPKEFWHVKILYANSKAEDLNESQVLPKIESPKFISHGDLLYPFLEHGVKVKETLIHQNVHDFHDPLKITFDSINSNFPFGLMNRQNKTEDYLRDALHKKKSMGKQNVPNVEFCMELIKYEEKDDHVIAVVKNTKNNVEEEIRCQYLVGCDGVHSTVRKGGNGWTFEGQTLSSSWVIADVEIVHELVKYDQAISFAIGDGSIAIFPLDARKNTVRIAVKIPEEENNHETNGHVTHGIDITLEELQKMIDVQITPIKLELKNLVWISRFKINERIVNRYRTGRVFVAGDAAHCHSPLGGQGMNMGIQDAHNLAFKLALAIRNQAADVNKLLDSYEQERYPVGKSVVEGTSFATKMLLANDFISTFLRTHVAPFMFHFFPQTTFKFQDKLFHYDLNYLPETSEIFHKHKCCSNAENKLIKAGHFVLDGLLKKITSHKSHEHITMFDVFRSTALKHTLILFTLNKGVTVD